MRKFGDFVLWLSLISLIVGLLRPNIFDRLTKAINTRKKIGLVFGSLIVITLFIMGVTYSGQEPASSSSDSQNTPVQSQQTSDSSASTSNSAQSPVAKTSPSKPALRQDLAFQGDASYCDGIYKDNGNGTTTWSYDIKHTGELITHLSDNKGNIYRHDVQITSAPNYYAYTAPVSINNVGEINGVLYVSGDSNGHPCNLNPKQQPQQAY